MIVTIDQRRMRLPSRGGQCLENVRIIIFGRDSMHSAHAVAPAESLLEIGRVSIDNSYRLPAYLRS